MTWRRHTCSSVALALMMAGCVQARKPTAQPSSLTLSDTLVTLAKTVATPNEILETIVYPPNEKVRQCLKFGYSRCPKGRSEGLDIVRRVDGNSDAPQYEVLAGSSDRPVYFAESGPACQNPDPSLCSYSAFPIEIRAGFISDGLAVSLLFCAWYRIPHGELAKSRMPKSSACEALGVPASTRGILGPFDQGFPFVWHSVLQESIITESLF